MKYLIEKLFYKIFLFASQQFFWKVFKSFFGNLVKVLDVNNPIEIKEYISILLI